MPNDRIVCDPKIMAGKPTIRGTRLKVETILSWLGRGMALDELLIEYPGLTREDVMAAQSFAAEYLASERVFIAAES
jgi:uncharacterized protein (DUF433 family)